jgi:hypothetical protein
MINSIKGGELALRVLGGVFFAFSLICRFSCHLLVLRVFFLLDDLLELLFGFWSSSCASCGLGFEIQTLCLCVVNVLIKGGD